MRWLLAIALFPALLEAQLTTGTVQGTIEYVSGRPASYLTVFILSRTGLQTSIQTSPGGYFSASLPCGSYTLSPSGVSIYVASLQTLSLNLVIDNSGKLRRRLPRTQQAGLPAGFSLQSIISGQAPEVVTVPLDFTGLSDNRLALISQRGLSWTNTQFKLQGLDATDGYQPGRPVILPDMQAVGEVVMRTGLSLLTSDSYGSEAGVFLAEPEPSWHVAISTAGTGSALASNNVPQPRGSVQRPQRFDWLTRDRAEAGGPLTSWADLFASVAGQWASQTVELAPAGQTQNTRMLFGTVRSDIRVGRHDRLDTQYSGSGLQVSNWGLPGGIEALAARRLSPEYAEAFGFADSAEADRFHFLQIGWTRQHGAGTLEARYGYSLAHLQTWPAAEVSPNQSRIELLGSALAGAPPLDTLATRERHQIAIAWQPATVTTGWLRHQISAGGDWEASFPRNQMSTPSNLNLITAAGAPAFVAEYNTPINSLEKVKTFPAYITDHLLTQQHLSFDIGVLAGISRGALPLETGDLIAWHSLSPRAAFAWDLPHLHRLVIGGGFLRSYSPLAGRYLDYANPNSLGGSVYRWIDRNNDGWFQPDERGALLLRFGGPYSSISKSLQQPYSDEIDINAQLRAAPKLLATFQLFRRDEKHRLAAIDTGLGANAFTAVQILDPGPDGIPGTFDDQRLTVFQQNPSTFGSDHYVLTNPSGLRELNVGLVAKIRSEWHGLLLDFAFTAEKAWGPTNPGNAYFENDPDVIGTLFIDPNYTNPILAHSYVDRAYIGKIQAAYRLPGILGRLDLSSIVNYMDGLPFARELLISGLAQGPFLIPATVRGSPEGGNRAQYVLNWNLRVAREFRLHRGRFAAFADILNVTNESQAIRQSDVTGPAFNLRLPLAIQPGRYLRLGLKYSF